MHFPYLNNLIAVGLDDKARRSTQALGYRRASCHIIDQDRADLATLAVDIKRLHHGLGGPQGAHFGTRSPLDGALAPEHRQVEFQGFERRITPALDRKLNRQ